MKKKTGLFFSTIIMLICQYNSGYAQLINLQKCFGDTGTEANLLILQTDDSGFVAVMTTNSYGAGGDDILFMKLDSAYNVEWAKTYGGSGDDNAMSLIKTNDDGYMVLGSTYGLGFGTSSLYLLKFDSLGTLQWSKTYGGFWDRQGNVVDQTMDNGYILGGAVSWISTKTCLIKIDSLGNLLWAKKSNQVVNSAYWNCYIYPDTKLRHIFVNN